MISINMASSVDGKIATKRRGPVKLGSKFDSKRMREIRKMHSAVIMGANTFAACPEYLGLATVVVSSCLDIPRHTPWEKAKGRERWIFCGKKSPRKKQEYLRTCGIRVVLCRGERPSAKEVLRHLRKAGHQEILLEGGGELNAGFLEKNFVDQIFLTLCPLTIGGAESPTFFEGQGAKKIGRWRLQNHKKVGDEIFLQYLRSRKKSLAQV